MKTPKTVIPAGYRLTIDSWENDADNPRKEIMVGMSEAEVRVFLDLARLCFSWKDSKRRGCFGNMYDPCEKEITVFEERIVEVVKASTAYEPEWSNEDSLEYGVEALEIMGLMGSEFYTRVFSSYKVEHFPVEISIDDVSAHFK